MTTLDDEKIEAAIAWMRRSHSAHVQGDRTERTCNGERAYQKWRKRTQRARLRDEAAA